MRFRGPPGPAVRFAAGRVGQRSFSRRRSFGTGPGDHLKLCGVDVVDAGRGVEELDRDQAIIGVVV
jgi:hypothetical protein